MIDWLIDFAIAYVCLSLQRVVHQNEADCVGSYESSHVQHPRGGHQHRYNTKWCCHSFKQWYWPVWWGCPPSLCWIATAFVSLPRGWVWNFGDGTSSQYPLTFVSAPPFFFFFKILELAGSKHTDISLLLLLLLCSPSCSQTFDHIERCALFHVCTHTQNMRVAMLIFEKGRKKSISGQR